MQSIDNTPYTDKWITLEQFKQHNTGLPGSFIDELLGIRDKHGLFVIPHIKAAEGLFILTSASDNLVRLAYGINEFDSVGNNAPSNSTTSVNPEKQNTTQIKEERLNKIITPPESLEPLSAAPPQIEASASRDIQKPATNIVDSITTNVKAEQSIDINPTHAIDTDEILRKVDDYFEKSSKAKNTVSKAALDQLMSSNVSDTTNVVSLLKLRIAPRTSGYKNCRWQLDLRPKKNKNNQLIKKLLGKKTLVRKESEAESIAYFNKLILTKVNEGVCSADDNVKLAAQKLASHVNSDRYRVADALKLSANENLKKEPKSIKEMNSKIGFWQHLIGHFPLDSLTYKDLLDITTRIKLTGPDASTLTGYVVEINKAMRLALDNGWVDSEIKLKTYQSNERPIFELSTEIKEKLISEYCQSIQEENYVRVCDLSGYRNGALLRLKEHQIHWDNNAIYWAESKSGKQLYTPICDEIKKYINKALLFKSENDIHSEYVFAKDNKGTLPKFDYTRWHKITDSQGIKPIKVNGKEFHYVPHHFRHEMATELRAAGVPIHDIMEAGGWTSFDGIKRYYHIKNMDLGSKLLNERNKQKKVGIV